MLSPFNIVALILLLFDDSSDAARIRGRDGRRWQQIPNNSADSVNQQIEAQQIAAEHEQHPLYHHRDERREEEDDPMLLEMANNSKAENQMKDSARLKVKHKVMDIGAHQIAEDDPSIEHNRDPMLEEAERRQVQVVNRRQKSAIIGDDDAIGATSKASSGHDGIQQKKDDPMLLEVANNNSKANEDEEKNAFDCSTHKDVVVDVVADPQMSSSSHHQNVQYNVEHRDPMLEEAEQNAFLIKSNGQKIALGYNENAKTGASHHGAIMWRNQQAMERTDTMLLEVCNNSKSEEYERQQQKTRRRNVAHAGVASVSVADDHHHDEHNRDPMMEEEERRPVVVYKRRQKSGTTIIGSTNEANFNASDDAIGGGSNHGSNNNNQDQGMMAAVFDSSVSSSSPVTRKQKKIVVDKERGEEPAIAHDIVLQQQQPQQQALFRQPGAPLKKRKHHQVPMTTYVYAREAAGSTEKKRYKAARKNPEPPLSSSSSSYHDDDSRDDSDSGEETEAASAESQQSTSIESLANDDDVRGEEAEAAAQKERQNPQERKKFTEANVRILQESFNKQKYLEDAEWLRLREETGLRLKQIGDWFKNARQRKVKNTAAEDQVERRDYDKTNFTESQLRTLTDAFDKHQGRLEDDEWIRLSQELGVRLQVIAKWFHNARQKAKDGATKKWEYKQKNKCVLQASFDKQNCLEDAEWLRLREETGLRLKQIGDWFKNARQSKAKNSAADEQIFLKRKNVRKQTKFTEAQKRILRKSFNKQNYLEDEEWIRLSQATGLRLKMIEDCFHNARYKQKPAEQPPADEQEGTAKKRKSKAMRKNPKSPAVKRNKTGTSDIAKTSHRKGRKERRRED